MRQKTKRKKHIDIKQHFNIEVIKTNTHITFSIPPPSREMIKLFNPQNYCTNKDLVNYNLPLNHVKCITLDKYRVDILYKMYGIKFIERIENIYELPERKLNKLKSQFMKHKLYNCIYEKYEIFGFNCEISTVKQAKIIIPYAIKYIPFNLIIKELKYYYYDRFGNTFDLFLSYLIRLGNIEYIKQILSAFPNYDYFSIMKYNYFYKYFIDGLVEYTFDIKQNKGDCYSLILILKKILEQSNNNIIKIFYLDINDPSTLSMKVIVDTKELKIIKSVYSQFYQIPDYHIKYGDEDYIFWDELLKLQKIAIDTMNDKIHIMKK
jgi:hypothetical protein